KFVQRSPQLLLALTTGLGGALLFSLVLALVIVRPARAVAAAAWSALAILAVSVVLAALSMPWTRFLFPARVAVDAAGLWALLAVIARARLRYAPRTMRAAALVLVLAWSAWLCTRGLWEARAAASERGLPSTATLRALAREAESQTRAGEVVMSNLGPVLAWYARRPVLHPALSPADLSACRQRVEFDHVLLVFREVELAWPAWRELVGSADRAGFEPDWNIADVRREETTDGFRVTWV